MGRASSPTSVGSRRRACGLAASGKAPAAKDRPKRCRIGDETALSAAFSLALSLDNSPKRLRKAVFGGQHALDPVCRSRALKEALGPKSGVMAACPGTWSLLDLKTSARRLVVHLKRPQTARTALFFMVFPWFSAVPRRKKGT